MSKDDTLFTGARDARSAPIPAITEGMGIFELLVVDDDMRRLILKNADESEIREAARKNGMKTLLEDGLE